MKVSQPVTWLPLLRRSEWVLIAFFLYMAALAVYRLRLLSYPSAVALLIPLALIAVARADAVSTHRGWSIVRDWLPAALVLVAYWSIDWTPQPRGHRELEHALIGWDRAVLNEWGLRTAIERFGALVPTILELAYLFLYVVLPTIIAGFYLGHQRDRLDDFLFPFLLGTLMTYSLLPHFPSDGPRVVFTGQDLPGVETAFRRLNVWILDHADIRSSIFPSGHVAVGFSAAFAIWLAVPERRALAWMLLAIAFLVWVSTVYGRYHYAADGLAGLAVSATAIGAILARRAQVGRGRNGYRTL